MELLIFWLGFAIVVGVIADKRGRSGIGWAVFSILLSPILGLILVLALGSKKASAAEDNRRRGPCWQCREMVVEGAKKCRFCGAELQWAGLEPRT